MTDNYTTINPAQVFWMGGPMMWPLLVCSVVALTVIVERFRYFFLIREDVAALKESIFSAISNNDLKAALKACDSSHSPTAMVLRAGLLKYGTNDEAITRAMEDASRLEVPRLEQGLTVLATVCQIVPLVGLLGTVLGLATLLYTAQVHLSARNPLMPQEFSLGLWQAVLTTVWSLVILIPSAVAYNYFVDRVTRTVVQMEGIADSVAAFLIDSVNRLSDGKDDGREFSPES